MAEVSRVLRLGIDAKDAKKGARQYESELDRVKRQSRETADETDRVERQAKKLGATAKETAAGLRDVAKAAETETERLQRLQREQAAVDAAHENFLEGRRRREQRDAVERAAEAADSGRRSAMAEVEALRSTFDQQLGGIRLDAAQGIISPQEAQRAGREVGEQFNAELARVIRETSPSAFQGAAGGRAFVDLTNQFQDVSETSKKAGLGLGRLNRALISATRQAAGADPVVGQLVNTVGSFAIGVGPMVPVLAGLSAIAFGYREITKEAREAEKEARKVREELERAAELRADPLKEFRESLRISRESLDATAERVAFLREQIAAMESIPEALRGVGAGTSGAGVLEGLRTELEEAQGTLFQDAINTREAQLQLDEERARLQENEIERTKTLAERQREALQGAIEQSNTLSAAYELGLETAEDTVAEFEDLRDTLANVASDEARARADRVDAARELLEVEREIVRVRLQQTAQLLSRQQDRDVLTGGPGAPSVGGFQFQDIFAPEVIAQYEVDQERLIAVLKGLGAESTDLLEILDPTVQGIASLATQVGSLGSNARLALRGVSDLISGIQSIRQSRDAEGIEQIAGLAGGIGAAIGGAFQIFNSIFGDSGPSEAELAQQRLAEERNRILEQNRDAIKRLEQQLGPTLEQLTTNLESAFDVGGLDLGALDPGTIADELMDILVGTGKGSFPFTGLTSRQDIESLADQLGIDILDPEGGFNTDALKDLAEAIKLTIEQIERAELAFQKDLRVRRLIAEGADEEAAALRRKLQNEREIQEALDKGFNETTIARLKEVQELERLAEAEREAARAREEAARTAERVADFDTQLGVARARAAGDQIEVARLLGEADIARQVDSFRDLVEAGELTEAQLAALEDALGEQLANELENLAEQAEESARAAREAAEAERFRQMVDMENLRVRLLVAKGMDREADALRDQLEIMQALQDGRSEEFIALLRQVQAAEDHARAQEEARRAVEETTRAIDGMTRVLNAPAGFSNRLLEAQATGAGSPIFGVTSPRFDGREPPQNPVPTKTTNVRIEQVVVQPREGEDVEAFWQRLKGVITRENAAAGFNTATVFGEG